jgi:2-keto-4-pentenoate hydratase/2-oxohepta-3-ene-1,7-dioic acid hydratase in catechol pathway
MAFERHVEGVAKLGGPDQTVPQQWYEAPAFYFTNPYAILGPHDDVPVAPGSQLFDLELEVAAVIGRAGRDIDPADADDHIAGYTILVDWSARDIQFAEMEVRLGPTKGKDTATTLGPVLVTPDELSPWRTDTAYDLAMTVEINGRQVGEDRWSSMAFSYAEMIAYASRGTEVRPGDILGSGTCGGGCLAELWGRHGFDAHAPLRAGDRVSVTVEQLGTASARIIEGVEPRRIPPARRQLRPA